MCDDMTNYTQKGIHVSNANIEYLIHWHFVIICLTKMLFGYLPSHDAEMKHIEAKSGPLFFSLTLSNTHVKLVLKMIRLVYSHLQ